MPRSIISEGKTTQEAIEKGLKELKLNKNQVEIKVLENDEKRSFFSILAPRVVKVELTEKEEKQEMQEEQIKIERKPLTEEEKQKAKENVETFLNEILKKLSEDTSYTINIKDETIEIMLEGKELGYLIGYRGETLYSLKNVLSAIAGKGIENRARVILDIAGYKEKREKALEELAEKIEKTVIRTRKSITLEPMTAYERKIIHTKLQDSKKVKTRSIGEEPRRRIVISLK